MSKQTDYDKLGILGVEIDAISNADAIEYIVTRAAPGQESATVIKPYVEFLDRAFASDEIRDLLNNAWLSVADGVALTWAAAYLYAGKRTALRFWQTLFQIVLAPNRLRWPLPDRAAGVNFTWPLLSAASERGLRVYLIGKESKPAIAAVAERISQKVPQLLIIGSRPGRDESTKYGQVSDDWLEETASAIKHAKADLVLIGMGFPLQDRVCAYLASHIDHGVFIGEGGTFDFDSFGGSMKRAPEWTQHLGLEWLWRLIIQPARLRRQLAIPRFIYRVWRSR
jgi:N-acetylglucosaminyldiphosphoundecaprenol N-acetyl-beta-D-mannosaminyltransferase